MQEKRKNRSNVMAIISLILFLIVLIINLVYYLLVRGDTSGGAVMMWAIGILPLSMLLYVPSVVLAIISLVFYRNDKKKNLEIKTSTTILSTFNILQLVVTIIGIISIIIWII